jgi:outer membrane biosynthesis protein TonB
VLSSSAESPPLILSDWPAGELLSEVVTLSRQQGWGELPLPVAATILTEVARGLSHLHALGFTHGDIRPTHVRVLYPSQAGSPVESGVHLGGVIEGNVFQLSPLGAAYGRGPVADVRAVVALFLDLITGQLSSDWRSNEATHPLILQRAQQLPPALSEWAHAVLSPQGTITHGGALLNSLTPLWRAVGQAPFDSGGISRWLGRIAPQRMAGWLQATQGDESALRALLPQLGPAVLVSVEDTSASLQSAPHTASPNATAPSPIAPTAPSPIAPTAPSSIAPTAQKPLTRAEKKAQAKARRPQHPEEVEADPPPEGFFPALDWKIDRFERRLSDKISPQRPAELKLRVALLWKDRVTSERMISLREPITIGATTGVTLPFPEAFGGSDPHTLFNPSGEGLLVHAPQGAQGWVQSGPSTAKQRWEQLADASMTSMSIGGRGLFVQGELGLYFSLEYVDPKPALSLKLPIPRGNALLLWSFGVAFLAHVMLIVLSFSAKSYTFLERGKITQSRFMEVLVEVQKSIDEKKEEELEELEEETTPTDEVVPDKDFTPRPPEEPELQEKVRERAQERFGKGKAAVDALTKFLSGEDQSSDRLSLGDASAALGQTTGDGSLSSAFGDLGGDISLGGGGGPMNTSGGRAAGRRAGKLKAKGGKRRVRGKVSVKALKSRVRVSGSLSKAEVDKVIGKHWSKISRCYERGLRKSPNLSGKLTVSWKVTSSGKTAQVKQVLSSLGSPQVSQCIMKIIKKLRFPKPKGGAVKIKYPFVFKQG